MSGSFEKQAALAAASILLETESVHFRPNEPFIFTSGRKSPVYIDCRRLISFPRARGKLMDMGVDMILRRVGYESLDAIAGGETAGIPFAASIAERLSLPMLHIRKKPKGFGRMAQIEGEMKEGARVLLVEDLASEGTSKINFVNAIRAAGGQIAHTFVLFNYGIFLSSVTSLANAGVALHGFTRWHDVLALAHDRGSFTPDQYQALKSFLDHPEDWEAPEKAERRSRFRGSRSRQFDIASSSAIRT